MQQASQIFEGGFSEPVTEAQEVFHALMHALANPGEVKQLASTTTPPAPLTGALGAIAATLLDHDTTLWCDPAIADSNNALAWLTFHTGTAMVSTPGQAQFALVTSGDRLPDLAQFAQGDAEFPDRSTTVILAVASLEAGDVLQLRGPGIETTSTLQVRGLPQDFYRQWQQNGALFPLGVDVILVAQDKIAAFPRTLRIKQLES